MRSAVSAVLFSILLLAVGDHGGKVVGLRTRSASDLFRIATATVDVPEEHLASGLAPRPPTSGPIGAQIRIRRSAHRPVDAMVGLKYYEKWYWIDSTDGQSEETPRAFVAITTAAIADTAKGSSMVPLLVVPVSRWDARYGTD